MKYLIVGLGNIGERYEATRHNIGFMILDAMALASNISFSDKRYGAVSTLKYKGRELILLKPSTFVNLSGNAVDYWMKKENIPLENLLIIVDDLALTLGEIRMRKKGSDGGHNGLSNISNVLSTGEYARIRIGIGNGFHKGGQVDFVLGKFNSDEMKIISKRMSIVIDMIKAFCFSGIEIAMTTFNKTGKMPAIEKDTDNIGNTCK
jgi:peptidyl-tRNA hydrolase, PTH1 family